MGAFSSPLFSLQLPFQTSKDFLEIRGASVEANPLSLKTHGKELKKKKITGGEDSLPRSDDDSIEMTGEKKQKMKL